MSTIHNAYTDKPVVDFEATKVNMDLVVDFIKDAQFAGLNAEVKRAVYVIFNNESGGGKKGVNNNYIGLQADGARLGRPWDDAVTATCLVKENMTGNMRRFCVFADFRPCLGILMARVYSRGLYVGGFAHPYAKMKIGNSSDLAKAYWKEWVMGDAAANMPGDEFADFEKQYLNATKHFA